MENIKKFDFIYLDFYGWFGMNYYLDEFIFIVYIFINLDFF